ncbi:hypothetical protein Hypma_011166, partial [Hypsizygus marmoreus]
CDTVRDGLLPRYQFLPGLTRYCYCSIRSLSEADERNEAVDREISSDCRGAPAKREGAAQFLEGRLWTVVVGMSSGAFLSSSCRPPSLINPAKNTPHGSYDVSPTYIIQDSTRIQGLRRSVSLVADESANGTIPLRNGDGLKCRDLPMGLKDLPIYVPYQTFRMISWRNPLRDWAWSNSQHEGLFLFTVCPFGIRSGLFPRGYIILRSLCDAGGDLDCVLLLSGSLVRICGELEALFWDYRERRRQRSLMELESHVTTRGEKSTVCIEGHSDSRSSRIRIGGTYAGLSPMASSRTVDSLHMILAHIKTFPLSVWPSVQRYFIQYAYPIDMLVLVEVHRPSVPFLVSACAYLERRFVLLVLRIIHPLEL